MVRTGQQSEGRTMGTRGRGAFIGLVALGLGSVGLASGCRQGAEPPAAEEPGAEKPGKEEGARAVTLTIKAEFPELPAGARVVAPSARDRQQLRVARTDHTGLVGQVASIDETESLVFVSDPVAGGPATYEARLDVTLRPVTAVDLANVPQDAWPEGQAPQVAPGPAELAPVAAPLNAEAGAPAARTIKALELAKGWKVEANGATDPLEVAREGAGSPYGITSAFVAVLSHAGVPARVVHGLVLPEAETGAARPAAWAEVQLPTVGWVPVDPVAAREQGAPPQGTRALDRVPLVYGAEITVPGTTATVQHALGGPVAVVGEGEATKIIEPTTYSAQVAPQADVK